MMERVVRERGSMLCFIGPKDFVEKWTAKKSVREPFFCPFCHEMFFVVQAQDFNHLVQCMVPRIRWGIPWLR